MLLDSRQQWMEVGGCNMAPMEEATATLSLGIQTGCWRGVESTINLNNPTQLFINGNI